ncbi:MAG: c-type cytochrome [Planctomycetes bacterium]|nr:c-type cytochrome [Planctomycetota bacterium]
MKYFWFSIVILLLTACTAQPTPTGYGTAWGQGAFSSNGERIYFTATSERGGRITYTGGPDAGGMMMGGSLSCASCHGPTGQGGQHVMHMQVMDAPDIRGAALAGEGHEGEESEHGGQYDLETFRLAVVEGRHPDGELLDADMPRWTMSDEDLGDLLDYLESLP